MGEVPRGGAALLRPARPHEQSREVFMVIQQRPRAAHNGRLSALSLAVSMACTPAVLYAQERRRCRCRRRCHRRDRDRHGHARHRPRRVHQHFSGAGAERRGTAIRRPARSHELAGQRGAVVHRAGLRRRHGQPDAAGQDARPESQPHAGAGERQAPAHHLEPRHPRRPLPGRRGCRPQLHPGGFHRARRSAHRWRGRAIRHRRDRGRHQHHP